MSEQTVDADLTRVHMIGIGGAGMSGIARILLARGSEVSGSDAKDSRVVLALRSMGVDISIGHDAANIDREGTPPTAVVTSFAAIPQDNPELVRARELNIPILRRSEMLALLMDSHDQILFAGTHGKTSSTSMAVVAMQQAGMDPSFAIGGQLNKAGTNAHHGTGSCFVAEADESDASLLQYRPKVAVVTNIEPDHLDYFKTHDAYFTVFDDFAARLVDDGTLVVCLNDEHAAALGERCAAKGTTVVGYGTREACSMHPDVPAGAIIEERTTTVYGTRARILLEDTVVDVTIHVPGEHMVLNAAAALLAGHVAGGDVAALAEGLSEFTGVRRRFEYHGTVAEGPALGVSVFDDYAHHPTEVSAVIRAAQDKVGAIGRGKVVVVFQPHLYSRTIEFATEFAAALSLADAVVVLDIFGAREEPVEGVNGSIIADKVSAPCRYVDSFAEVPGVVAELVNPHDIVLTMGAGSVTMLADEILEGLSSATTTAEAGE